MARRMTPKQAAAIKYLNEHPNATPGQIARAIGTSISHNNPATFIERLVTGGYARIVPTDEATNEAVKAVE